MGSGHESKTQRRDQKLKYKPESPQDTDDICSLGNE